MNQISFLKNFIKNILSYFTFVKYFLKAKDFSEYFNISVGHKQQNTHQIPYILNTILFQHGRLYLDNGRSVVCVTRTSSLVDLSWRGGVVGCPAWLSRSGSTELVRDPLPSLLLDRPSVN